MNVLLSYRRCKGTAVLGDGEIFSRLLPKVVATGGAICDKGLMRRQNRVASKDYQKLFGSFKRNHYFCTINVKLKHIMV